MIFVKDKIYAKVWKVEKFDKYIDLQATTSEKDKDGNYINSGWYPRLIGHAFNSLKDTIKEGDTIVFTKSKLSNERYVDNEGNKKSRFRFLVFEAEPSDSADSTPTTPSETKAQTPSENKEDSPW